MGELRNYRRLFSMLRPTGRKLREETNEEIDAHLEMRVADLMARGSSERDARAEAVRLFGDLRRARDVLYAGAEGRNAELHRRDLTGALIADARFAIRQARRAPGFTAIVIATLAIGIGLTTMTLTLAERVLIRALPFPSDHELVSLESMDSSRSPVARVSHAAWRAWTAGTQSLAASALYADRRFALLTRDGAMNVEALAVTAGFFPTLKPRFLLGRSFDSTEVASGQPLVVISAAFWRHMLGEDPTLSQPVRTAAQSYRVVGVLADGQEFPAGKEMWIGTRINDPGANNINYEAIARLRRGATFDEASRELDARAAAFRRERPEALYSWGVAGKPLKAQTVGEAAEYLRLLLVASALVLLVACANVAAANLGRGSARLREMAVRAAIGAGRRRLIQQLLVEHLTIGLIAGVLGIALGWAALRVMIDRWGSQIPRVAEVQLDPVILAGALLLAVLAGVLTGILPALNGSRASVVSLMSGSGRGFASGGRGIPTRALVAAQVATAVVLVTSSTMLLRSFSKLLDRGLGFDPRVAVAEVALTPPAYRGDTNRAFAYWAELRRQLESIPGVRAAGLSNRPPLIGGGTGFIEIEGRTAANASAGYRVVDAHYFDAMRIPLRRGRWFTDADRLGSERVTVINEAMAERYWPDQDPIGKRVKALSMEPSFTRAPVPWLRVVGVVGNVRHYGLQNDIAPEMFTHYSQVPLWMTAMTAVVSPDQGSAQPLMSRVGERARAIDRSIAVSVTTLEHALREDLAERTMIMSLVCVYGLVALLLAALGTYGMLLFAVARRTRELAVRTALGAERHRVVLLVMAGAAEVAVIGIVTGVVGSLAASKLLESNLVDVSPHDPISVIVGAALLGVIAMVACIPPVLRATKIDPLTALRAE